MKPIKIIKEAEELICRLNKNGHEAYLVGGCVRDYLLCIDPKDWDLTTSATPEVVMSIFSDYRVIETGLKHGTVTVIVNNIPFEITTFRTESVYEDYRRPKEVFFVKSVKEDLSRRDFTINAMAMNEKGEIIDFFSGHSDLNKRLIRTVGVPEERFSEDALRILRMYRFAAQLDFNIEEETLKSAELMKDLLLNISKERVISELDGILNSKNPKNILELMYNENIIQTAIELEKYTKSIKKTQKFTSINNVSNEIKNYYVRLAMLYNTIFFKTFLENKFNTAPLKKLLKNMSYPNKTIDRVLNIIIVKDRLIQNYCKKTTSYQLRSLVAKYGINVLEDSFRFNFASYNDIEILKKLKDNKKIFRDIIKNGEVITLKELKINGSDLIKENLGKGKEIGETLNYLLDRVHIQPKLNEKTILLELVKNHFKK